MGKPEWTEEEMKMIVSRYNQGVTVPVLARICGRSTHLVRKLLRQHHVYRDQFVKTLNGNDRESIIASYKSGESVPELSKKWHTSQGSLYRLLEQSGVKRDLSRYGIGKAFYIPKNKFNSTVEMDIVKQYAAGIKSGPLAAQYQCSAGTIREIVRRHSGSIKNRGNSEFLWTPELERDVIHAYKTGMSMQRIWWTYNISMRQVARMLRRNKIIGRRAYPKRERHGSWKGGKSIRPDGYVQVRLLEEHPYASMMNCSHSVLEHRLVMAQHLGRPLLEEETVHHKDGVRSHNEFDNLELWIVPPRKGQRVEDLIKYIVTFHRDAVTKSLQESAT